MRKDDSIGTAEGTFVYQDLLDRAGFVDATLTTNTLAYLSEVPGPLSVLNQSLPVHPNGTLNGGTSPQPILFPNAPGGPAFTLPVTTGGFYVIQGAYNVETSIGGFPFTLLLNNGGGANDNIIIQDQTDPYLNPGGPITNTYIPFSVFFQAQGTTIGIDIVGGTIPGGQTINATFKPFYLWRIR
jgi:hypothetical protein